MGETVQVANCMCCQVTQGWCSKDLERKLYFSYGTIRQIYFFVCLLLVKITTRCMQCRYVQTKIDTGGVFNRNHGLGEHIFVSENFRCTTKE